MKTMKYIDSANGGYSAAETASKRKEVAQETGCKGSYALRQLPGHDRVANTPVDPMHLLKNIAEHLINLLSGVEDSEKVRREEQSRGRFRSAWLSSSTSVLPPAPFVLTKEHQKLANKRAISIRVPTDYDWRPRAFFGKISGTKSHKWKLIM